MTDRSRTPSPNKARNLEKGVFSSLSTLTFVRTPAEERKTQTNSSSVRSNNQLRSPIRTRPSPTSTKAPATDRVFTPDTSRKSRLHTNKKEPESSLVKEKEEEILKLQANLKKLTNQLSKERKNSSKLEEEFKEFKRAKNSEMNQVLSNMERIQKSFQALKTSHKTLQTEKTNLTQDLDSAKKLLETHKNHLENLSGFMVDVVSTILKGDSSDTQNLQKFVAERLSRIQEETAINLEPYIQQTKTWKTQSNLGNFNYFQESENPQISYTVEYFDDSPSSLGSTQEHLHPLNPLKNLETNSLHSSFIEPGESLSERIINKIRGQDVSFTNEQECAIALYDFEGEQEGDLSFSRGDVIEILQKTETGWWIGRIDDQVGSFPYNFVQLM